MNYTPGPWYCEGVGGIQMDGIRDGYVVNSAEQRRIAVMHASSVPRDQRWPNANLIAAAPELLAAAEEGLSALIVDGIHGGADSEPECPQCLAISILLAVIKKAKGL